MDDGSLKVKARIVVHGNGDVDKELVRIYFSSALIMTVRNIILDFTGCFNLGTTYIKGTFMKSWYIRRKFYVRPPRDFHRKRVVV